MAAEWVELGKEVLKLAVRARYSFSLWMVCLLILVVPLPDFLRLNVIRQKYGEVLGAIGLSMFVVWVVEVFLLTWEAVKGRLTARREEKKVLKHLDSLTSREAHLLAVAVTKKVQTVNWKENSPEVSSLIAKGLLSAVPANSQGNVKPFTVPRFVWEEINKTRVYDTLKQLDKEKTA